MAQYYIQIAPLSLAYHGQEPLTYCSDQKLSTGQIVSIGLRRQQVRGIVLATTKKPDFKTTTITETEDMVLPQEYTQLLLWMSQYYPGPLGPLSLHFLPKFVASPDSTKDPIDRKDSKTPDLPPLTTEQKEVLEAIKASKNSSFILHGETGTGKTRVYIELARETFKQNRSVLVLTPEISLTSPLYDQFVSQFGADNVLITHSNQTTTQRRKVWQKAQESSKPMILIGPRSALFVPLKPGLIIVDESHDQAYKQESAPYYDALRVASKLAGLGSAQLIFGSATPLINEYFLAEQKNIPILRMQSQAITSDVKAQSPLIVNLADEDERSSQPLLSKTLLSLIENNLKKKQQALLFLNKRGSARVILCASCGFRAQCPHCETALTYHHDHHRLQCHLCGHRQSPPSQCPDCGQTEIVFKSPGTKSIELALSSIFPQARIARFDRDNKKAERIESLYTDVRSGAIDILVGTQLLSKGHDLPRLGLVAMLAADNGLAFPDFTTDERFFQLIRQLKGRVNRGHISGQMIIQTYQPDNAALAQAIQGEWSDFYKLQLASRKQLHFPPWIHALKITAVRTQPKNAQEAITRISEEITANYPSVRIIGPAPRFIEKQAGKAYWQIIVSSPNRSQLLNIVHNLPSNTRAELDPRSFL